MDLNLLAGPAALAIAASVMTGLLWRQHVADQHVKDAAIATLTSGLATVGGELKNMVDILVDLSDRMDRLETEAKK